MRWILLTATLLPAALAAQTPSSLHVEGVGEPVSVGVAMHRGYPAYPAWTLRALGARVDGTTSGARIVFGPDTLLFHAGSPFFLADGSPRQLVDAPYRQGEVFYLPHQLFAEWLPAAYPERVRYDGGRLALTSARAVAAADAREPSTRPAGAEDTPKSAAAAESPDASAAAESDAPAPRRPAQPLGKPATPLVVVDAGHGGPDSGRIGPSGLKEKDVVLQVSKRLAKALAARGYDVRMTRTRDTLIGLYDRAPMANEWRGDRPGLFLSIHANGVSNRGVTGYETFFLSDARTDDERRVAEMENAALKYESPDRVVATDDLGLIYNNLRNEFYIRASNSLAGLVQDELGSFHAGHNRGVKQAGFVVLVGAFMPAVLIELAFISNPAEERLLGSGRFQLQAAEAIADAVDRFFDGQRDRWGAGSP